MVVASRKLFWVEIFGQQDRRQAIAVPDQTQLSGMEIMVVGAAGRTGVFCTGDPAVFPRIYMADFAVFGRHRASRNQATAVPGQNRFSNVVGHVALFATKIEDLAFAVENDGQYAGIAQQSPELARTDIQSVGSDAGPLGQTQEGFELAMDHQGGPGKALAVLPGAFPDSSQDVED